jgi:S-adenosylmethionine:tRNA ribosyltransferase-isomerase
LYSLSDYFYELPPERIAQKPAENRENSRLLVLNREKNPLSHHHFSDIADFLHPPDLLVINDTEVIPGRLYGRKSTGGKCEFLLLNYGEKRHRTQADGSVICQCLIRASKRPGPGVKFYFDADLQAETLDFQKGVHTVRFSCPENFEKVLFRIGNMPLPPYIRRNGAEEICDDRKVYQTVYASQKGAVAAPTAGLHFTKELLEKIRAKGVGIVRITLHVGYGTFVPVRVKDIRKHEMHSEWFSLSSETAARINEAREKGGRVVAVGTTSVRTLEYLADEKGVLSAGSGECNLFIYPGYRFRAVSAMITNFHLPESTLLMLVSAFAGREKILAAYRQAIKEKYRFYSYGDAMLIV